MRHTSDDLVNHVYAVAEQVEALYESLGAEIAALGVAKAKLGKSITKTLSDKATSDEQWAAYEAEFLRLSHKEQELRHLHLALANAAILSRTGYQRGTEPAYY